MSLKTIFEFSNHIKEKVPLISLEINTELGILTSTSNEEPAKR